MIKKTVWTSLLCLYAWTPSSGGKPPPPDPEQRQKVRNLLQRNRLEPLIARSDSAQSTPFAITVSGGVSLGSYQAGYLFFATEWLKAAQKFEVNLITGASAGSINALFTGLALCDEAPILDPRDSPFYRAWIPIGFQDLREGGAGPLSILNREALKAMAANLLDSVWRQGPGSPCDFVLGISGTRLGPRPQEITKGLKVPKQKEKFLIRIQGDPAKPAPQRWTLSNYFSPESHLRQPFLPFGEGKDTAVLAAALFASASFPVAFPPQPMEYCLVDSQLYNRAFPGGGGMPASGGWSTLVRAAKAMGNGSHACPQTGHFLDGGIFDNNPLALAYKTAGKGLRMRDGHAYWLDRPAGNAGPDSAPASLYFMYLDPDQSLFPRPGQGGEMEEKFLETLLPTVMGFGKHFIAASRSEELHALVEDHPGLSRRVGLTSNYFPLMSDFLSAFFGFYETEFRVFDFHMGIYDAYKYISQNVKMRGSDSLSFERLKTAMRTGYGKRMECLLGILDTLGRPEACLDSEAASFRILLQASMDRFREGCRPLVDSLGFNGSAQGETAPVSRSLTPLQRNCLEQPRVYSKDVPGVKPLTSPQFERFRSEMGEETSIAELNSVLLLLEFYGYPYRDLRRKPPGSPGERLSLREAKEEIRGEWLSMIEELADAQSPTFGGWINPVSDRNLIKLIAKPAVNVFQYQNPRYALHLAGGIGGAELEFGRRFFSHYRANLGFQAKEVASILKFGEPSSLLLTPLLGLQVGHGTATFQSRFSLRAGMEFDRETHSPNSDLEGWDRLTKGELVLQAVPKFTLFDRLGLQAVLELQPGYNGGPKDFQILLEAMFQWFSPFFLR